MDEKKLSGYNTTASFVIFSLALTAAIIGMFMFVKLMGENTKYSDNKDKTTEPTSETTTTSQVSKSDDDSISYVAKLSDIVSNNKTTGDYSLSINYQGTNYYFKCTSFDESKNKCTNGLGLLHYNYASIPLYVFDDSENDYLNNGNDFYIIVNDDYVVFTYDSNTIVYTANGEEYLKLDNILTSYETSDKKLTTSYPAITDNNLIYYICDTNTVLKRGFSLENKKISSEDIITGAVC